MTVPFKGDKVSVAVAVDTFCRKGFLEFGADVPVEPLRAPWEGRSVSLTIARQHWDAMPADVRAEVERLCHGVRFEFGAVPSVECGPLAEHGSAHTFVLAVCERFGVVALVERAS